MFSMCGVSWGPDSKGSTLDTAYAAWHMSAQDGLERKRPHCILGAASESATVNGDETRGHVDLALSYVASFYETPILGWASQHDFSDQNTHSYYMRLRPLAGGLAVGRPIERLALSVVWRAVGRPCGPSVGPLAWVRLPGGSVL